MVVIVIRSRISAKRILNYY